MGVLSYFAQTLAQCPERQAYHFHILLDRKTVERPTEMSESSHQIRNGVERLALQGAAMPRDFDRQVSAREPHGIAEPHQVENGVAVQLGTGPFDHDEALTQAGFARHRS